MKYLILIYTNPQLRSFWQQMPEDQQAEGMRRYAALNAELADSGELITTDALAGSAQVRHVRVRDERPITTDGPFAETKEQLAGFYLVDCETMDRATEIAARIPEAAIGTVEVWPIHTYPELAK